MHVPTLDQQELILGGYYAIVSIGLMPDIFANVDLLGFARGAEDVFSGIARVVSYGAVAVKLDPYGIGGKWGLLRHRGRQFFLQIYAEGQVGTGEIINLHVSCSF